MKIEKRPWKPQDLLDDLQSIIDKEPDCYLNTMRSTLCMARDYLKEFFSSPPNDPLTLEELREMDGEPVWISYFAGGPNVCMLVDAKHDVCRDAHGGFAVFENLGRTWLAYRRKPEEETWQQ